MNKKRKRTVKFELDEKKPAPLSAEQKEELMALADLPDEQIDYGDLPPLDDNLLEKALREDMYRPCKKQLTLRIDIDVITWLRKKGKGYQSRINSILRHAMLREFSKRRRSISHPNNKD